MHLEFFCKARLLAIALVLFSSAAFSQEGANHKLVVDWGHWRLGHKADPEFLQKNHLTLTFGSGAPNFETVTREEFDQAMAKAKAFNKEYHDKGYLVLRYLSTSLNGTSGSNQDAPQKEQIRWLKFYNESWQNFEDYLGPKPAHDPTTWITVHRDGTFPHYRYAPYGQQTTAGFETWGCPDNPDYVRIMEGKVRAQAETGIDGSYVDWTHIAGGTCYCEFTRANFIKYLKQNLPPEIGQSKYATGNYEKIELPQKRGDKFWMEWITYRGHVVAEFHKHLRTVARQYHPHFMISGNVFGGFGYGPIAYDAAGNMEMLAREGYDDFIYSEIQEFLDSAPRKNEEGTKITNSPALKFLAAASHGKPVIVYATEITPPIFPNPTEKCLSAMAQINIAEAAANHAVFREKRETPPGATQIYEFLAAHEDKLLGAHLHSNVAVLASLNQYLADELSFAFSASRVLADEGLAHVMIVEEDLLSARLSDFDLILLPYIPLLSQQKQEALQRYVEKGGTLLILGNSGAKNEFNLPHEQIALAGLFGGKSYPAQAVEKKIGKGRAGFVPLVVPESKFLIPSKATGAFTTFGPTMADVFADIPEGYTRNRIDPVLRESLVRVARKTNELLEDKVTRLITKTPYVEITTMRPEDNRRMLVHLVNYDVTVEGDLTPAQNLQVQLAVAEGKKVKSVSYSGTLGEMKPLEFVVVEKAPQQIIRFQPDALNIYGLAVVALE
ncbi:hypothetical protein HUU05_19935 [candidate division KSB1 bacterium]|nr:hypothetical protein [candidate division KSB1 bacterium]